jgi:parvulin-like peptidyl-prolyl isomerase
VQPRITFVPQEPVLVRDYGPEVLLPDPQRGDVEVARVGDLVLRQSHAFARLLAADPKLALSAIDLLVFDVLVCRHAQQFGIRVDPVRVHELAQRDEEQLQAQVRQELGAQLEFADYVWRIFGMRIADWRRTAELRVAQRLYQGYVIRYLASREDRVQVRYLVHRDKKVVEEVAQKVADGADFATLALRHSEDSFRRDGGLLPPFGPGFPHPAADVAFGLQKGQLSPVHEAEVAGEKRYYLVYCLDRIPGKDQPFEAVRAEIDKDLQERPLTAIETNAYTLRWRGRLEDATAKSAAGDAPKTDDSGTPGR